MKPGFLFASLLFLTAAAAVPADLDFAWRKHAGDFPKDKPGYLILTTADAVQWSQMLPAFVRQKQAMGFHVYVATEKDYGSGKTGNAQAMQVRAWMREMQKRTGAKYALLIGNSNPGSADFPSPTIPDGEHGGLEAAYCDLDGKWVDIYLAMDGKQDTRSAWTQMCAGSILLPQAFKQGGPRQDDIITSRISYAGNEIGNGAYDLDRILEKTIRYEQDTVAGKNLDWRGRTLSVITNYGGANWDDPLIRGVEQAGGSIEWRSNLGISGSYVPENIFDGKAANASLMARTGRAGMVCTMSHGWNRGGEGISDHPTMFRDMDHRWPASVGVAACTGFALADNCNQGQTWLRTGAIFACGTPNSANNGFRVPLQVNQLAKRQSVGEAVNNGTVQYGDPSLHVLPPAGSPVCALRIQPAMAGHYEERTLEAGRPIKAVEQTYTLANLSKEPMTIALGCDAAWVDLSTSKVELQPGESAQVTARSTDRLEKMAPGSYVARICIVRGDGQRDERRLAVKLAPVSLAMAYSFDTTLEGNRFPDLAEALPKNSWHDNSSLWLVDVSKGPHWNPFVKPGAKIGGCIEEAQGRVAGALRLDQPKKPFSRGMAGFTRWRGVSASLWFRVDALPPEKKSAVLLSAPFALSLDATGALTFAQGDKPGALGQVTAGTWHFLQFRTDVAAGKVRARFDGQPEVIAAAKVPLSTALTLGQGTCTVDEIKLWSGELSDASQDAQLAIKDQPFSAPAPFSAPDGSYVDDGVLRAPRELPAVFDLKDASSQLDLSKTLSAAGLACTELREAPEWLDHQNGILSLKSGSDFDRIDFGGYDCLLVLRSSDGRVCEHSLKVRIPVPAVNIRIARAADNTLSIVNAGDAFGKADRPLAKGVIHYTTDGSPVTLSSPVYTGPFKATGDKVTARFFYLGEYPYAPATMGTEFGIPREKWKPLASSGKPNPKVPVSFAFDGRNDTAWKNNGGVLPQFLAWDLGEQVKLAGISVHSTVRDPNGRINGYTLFASDDGKTWNRVKSGELENSPNVVRIAFGTTCTTRFLKLEANSLHQGTDMVITEIEAFAK